MSSHLELFSPSLPPSTSPAEPLQRCCLPRPTPPELSTRFRLEQSSRILTTALHRDARRLPCTARHLFFLKSPSHSLQPDGPRTPRPAHRRSTLIRAFRTTRTCTIPHSPAIGRLTPTLSAAVRHLLPPRTTSPSSPPSSLASAPSSARSSARRSSPQTASIRVHTRSTIRRGRDQSPSRLEPASRVPDRRARRTCILDTGAPTHPSQCTIPREPFC